LIKQLAALAVEINPTATLVPAGTTDPGKTVAAELEAIRELRRNNPTNTRPTRNCRPANSNCSTRN
jgi:hypothetical protein